VFLFQEVRNSGKTTESQPKAPVEESSAEKCLQKSEPIQPKVTSQPSQPQQQQPVQVQIGSEGQSVDAIQLPANFNEPFTFSKVTL